jgi:hypothetical protein
MELPPQLFSELVDNRAADKIDHGKRKFIATDGDFPAWFNRWG